MSAAAALDAQAMLHQRRMQQYQASCSAPLSQRPLHRQRAARSAALAADVTAEPAQAPKPTQSSLPHHFALPEWLGRVHRAPQPHAELIRAELPGENLLLRAVAAHDISEGVAVLSIPEAAVITLAHVFEDEAVTELLTTGKLSELACLTLFLMYEKKRGKSSPWHPFIHTLDMQRGRGQQGAKSPLLWDPGQAERLLAGSPIVADIAARVAGIRKEWAELDTVWFMAGSLFRDYPYDVPSEAFSFRLFLEGFAAVQASVVHLQGVPLSKRFALVPFGPPLLTYSSSAGAMLKYEPSTKQVQLVSDRHYRAGQELLVWCGPQPNRRLLINYGFVDEGNLHDRLAVTVTLPGSDPLYQLKRSLLQRYGMASQQTFQLARDQELPQHLYSFLRFAHATDEASTQAYASFDDAVSLGGPAEAAAIAQLHGYLESRIARYPTNISQDDAVVADPAAGAREKVAARLVRGEKAILCNALLKVQQLPRASATAADAAQQGPVCAVHLS